MRTFTAIIAVVATFILGLIFIVITQSNDVKFESRQVASEFEETESNTTGEDTIDTLGTGPDREETDHSFDPIEQSGNAGDKDQTRKREPVDTSEDQNPWSHSGSQQEESGRDTSQQPSIDQEAIEDEIGNTRDETERILKDILNRD